MNNFLETLKPGEYVIRKYRPNSNAERLCTVELVTDSQIKLEGLVGFYDKSTGHDDLGVTYLAYASDEKIAYLQPRQQQRKIARHLEDHDWSSESLETLIEVSKLIGAGGLGSERKQSN